jgi:hypothetical protein
VKYQPLKLNVAQQMLVAMGLDDLRLSTHHGEQNRSNTKAGPGRMHLQGREKDSEGKPMPKSIKQLQAGSYGRGLRNARTRQNLDMIERHAAKPMAQSGHSI